LEELASEVVYKTPSEFDSILIVTRSGIQHASEGRYGGWIVRGQLAESDVVVALWCYEQGRNGVDVGNIEDPKAKRFLEELAKHGFDFDYVVNEPKARIIRYKYRPVNITVKKVADHYTVIDMVPAPGDVIEAEAVHIYWSYHISRKGHCSGFCSENMREKVTLVAKMLGLEAYREETGNRDYEVRVKIVSDYSQVAGYLRSKLLAPEPEMVTPATAEAGLPPLPELPGEAPEVEVGGGVATAATPATPPDYVKTRLLDFDLPTEYIGGRTTTVLEVEGEREAETVKLVEKKEVRMPELRALRKKFYNVLKKIAFKASGLWVLMHGTTENELEELNDVMAEINAVLAKRGMPARNVNVVEAYLPERWVKVKLTEYVNHVMSELEARKAAEKKTRDVLREIKRLEELLERLMREQKFYEGGSVTLQGVA
jgi:hypothetical protein